MIFRSTELGLDSGWVCVCVVLGLVTSSYNFCCDNLNDGICFIEIIKYNCFNIKNILDEYIFNFIYWL